MRIGIIHIALVVIPLLLAPARAWTQEDEDSDEPRENREARAAYRLLQKGGGISPADLMHARDHIDRMREQQRNSKRMDAGINTWEWLGPGNIGGRIRAIAHHPTSPGIMWVGAAGGGIWKTTNSGSNWFPLEDFLPSLAVTSIVVDPNQPDVIYAATGEGFNNIDALPGAGIFRSTNGGTTWWQLPGTTGPAFQFVNRLAHHPVTSNSLLAVTKNGNGGAIWKSLNGGISWDSTAVSFVMTDVKFHPTQFNFALASGVNAVYFSTNGGLTWVLQTTGVSGKLPNAPGRCEAAFATTNNYMYVTLDIAGGMVARSTDNGTTWLLRNVGTNFLGTAGWYANTIWVSPANANLIVVGGLDLWRSTNGGSTLTRISDWHNFHNGGQATSAHADQHAIVSHPTIPTIVYVGNDGGIQQASDINLVTQNAGWTNLANNLGITQFYGGAAAPNGSIIVGGAQDNDKLHYTPLFGRQAWLQPETGDGGFAAVNFNLTSRVYGEYTNLIISRSDNAGATYVQKTLGLTDAGDPSKALFIAPFVMDPSNPNVLVAGGSTIWYTNTSADVWLPIRTPISGNPLCSAIDIAKSDGSIVWVGYANGVVSKTSSLTSWTNVNAGLPAGRYVTDIAIHPVDPNQVFVTFAGPNTNNVWFTTDAGATWLPRSGTAPNNLPALQVNTVRFHPVNRSWVYIGTDLGVFASENKGLSWETTPLYPDVGHEGPVNTEVAELFWQGNDYLIAATHGRGMYRCRPFWTVYSDLNYTGVEEGTEARPFNTFREAYTASGNGTTVSVKAGVYNNEGPITISKRVTIQPSGGGITIR